QFIEVLAEEIVLFAISSDDRDRRARLALQKAADRDAGFGGGDVIDVARFDGLVRVENCDEQPLRRPVADRSEVGADLLSDAGELMAGGAVFFEELGAFGRIAPIRYRNAIFRDQFSAVRVRRSGEYLCRSAPNFGITVIEQL